MNAKRTYRKPLSKFPTPRPHIRYVYVLQTEIETYKIGLATDLRNRVSSIRTACPFALDVLLAIPISSVVAENVERSLHRRYDEYRFRGEWFLLPDGHSVKSFATDVLVTASILEKAHSILRPT